MGSSFFMFLGVKFQWFSSTVLTMSTVSSDMSANFWRAWWAWLICFVLTILISLVTPKKPEAELVGLVKGLTADTVGEELPWFKRPGFFAAISLVVLVVLNILFW
jgi:SSS family solute:Na+ symporter